MVSTFYMAGSAPQSVAAPGEGRTLANVIAQPTEAVDYDGAPTEAYAGLLTAVHRLGRARMAQRWSLAKRRVLA